MDHSSELCTFLYDVCFDKNKLLNYLFSTESFIKTGNDNEDEDYPDEDYETEDYSVYVKGN